MGIGDSQVTTMGRVVKNGYHPPLKIVATGNNQGGVLPPGVVFVLELMQVCPLADCSFVG